MIPFFRDVSNTYKTTFLFLGTAFLVLVPFIAEMAQHFAEWKFGMFTRRQRIDPGFEENMRLILGYLKVASICIVSVLVPMYLYRGKSWTRVFVTSTTWLRGFAAGVAVMVTSVALGYVSSLLVDLLPVASPVEASIYSALLSFVLGFPLVFTIPWMVGLFVGDPQMNLKASWLGMWGRWFWAYGLLFAFFLPPMILHQALNIFARGQSDLVIWILLALDSLVVSYIAIGFGALNWIVYEAATERANKAKQPEAKPLIPFAALRRCLRR